MNYQWDDSKSQLNLLKHGVSFSDSADFEWELALTFPDVRKDYGEDRFVSLAPMNGRLHAMVWTSRGDEIRIIGIRKANEREEVYYDSQAK